MITDLFNIATALAEQIGRPVAIDDPTMRLLAHTPHHGPVDPVRMQSILHLRAQHEPVQWVLAFLADATGEWVRVPTQERWELLSRVCAPVRHEGRLYGYLWVTDADSSVTEHELGLIVHAARAAARVLADQGIPPTAAVAWERSLVEDLLGSDRGARDSAARALASLCSLECPTTVLTLGTPPDASADSIYLALGRLAPQFPEHRLLSLVRADHTVVLVPTVGSRDVVDAVAAAARTEIGRVLGAEPVTAAGDEVSDLHGAPVSHRQARAILEHVVTGPDRPHHARWSALGIERLLLHIPESIAIDTLIPPRLVELMNDPGAADLLQTVSVYLDHACDVQASVAELHVHRTSVYYRLRRFQEISGFDLRDGQDVLTIHAALALARLRRL